VFAAAAPILTSPATVADALKLNFTARPFTTTVIESLAVGLVAIVKLLVCVRLLLTNRSKPPKFLPTEPLMPAVTVPSATLKPCDCAYGPSLGHSSSVP
jgi:hypothetical protein